VESARLLANDFPLDELESLAREELTEFAERLPSQMWPEFVTEAGSLEQTVRRGDEVIARRTVRYIMSSCRGVIFPHDVRGSGRRDGQWSQLWTGTVEASELPHDLPAVLGPAALLALVMHLDAADDDGTFDRPARTPIGPIVVREMPSPYPPHTSPVDLLTSQQLQDDEPPPPSRLRGLFRPEWWSRPAGALIEDTLSSVLISCELAREAPARSVVIEEMVPVSSDLGSGRWLARATLRTNEDQLASRTDLALIVDPLRMVENCRGALSGVQVAVVGNPIAGERYGFAPFVLVSERLAELVK
jgi:hypothetical protein